MDRQAVTAAQLIDQLQRQVEGVADDHGVETEQALECPVFAGIHDGLGTRWFKVTGVAPLTTPGEVPGLLLDLGPAGTSEGVE